MRLLVTGGAGFIGSNFIHYWLRTHPEDEVVNLDLLTYAGNLANLDGLTNNAHYSFVQGDINDRSLVLDLIKNCDVVVHFAAESHVDRSIQDSTPFVKTNVLGTQVLLDTAVKVGGRRFHHVSTDEVFGALPLAGEEKFNERTAYNPHSPYAASKAASDHLVRAFGDTFNLPYTISNCSNNFGPRQHVEKLLPLAITNLLQGKKVPIYGDGLYVRDWLYVDDHCRAIDLILHQGKIGETYCLGGLHKDVNNLELIKKVLKILELTDDYLEFVVDRPGHDRRYSVDFSKAETELGYQPEAGLDDYLKLTIDWYRDHEDWWKK